MGKMYPLLKGYLNHWLVNRTDSAGYQICMCSWESGQDMMYRWGWNQSYGGDRSSRIIRAPEHQAAMSHAAGVMKSVAGLLELGAKEESFWAGVRDTHANLTKSLFVKKEGWFCDYNSKVGVWQSGCNDDGPAVDPAGAGKQSYQLAPLFFDTKALGVSLLDEADPATILKTVGIPDQFGSDQLGSLTFASYCASTPVDPRCVTDIWAPHPWLMIAAAGNCNQTALASSATHGLVDRVWGKMDARSRIHFDNPKGKFLRSTSPGSPYPGAAFECLSKGLGERGPMSESCGSEDYAWTAEATTVSVLREIVGFREHPDFDAGVFILRPSLSVGLMERALAQSGGGRGAAYIVRGLQFRGFRFDIYYTVTSGTELAVRLESAVAKGSSTDGNTAAVEFVAKNGVSTFHVSFSASGALQVTDTAAVKAASS